MKNHVGRFVLVLLVVALSAWAFLKKEPPLGLDLAGGSSLTYQATSSEGELTPERVKRAIQVIENRLNATGVAEISITPTQANEIVVELPGRTPQQIRDIKDLIQRNGHLQFRIQADSETEANERRQFEESGGTVKPPPGYDWVGWNPTKFPGRPKMLLRTPEKPIREKLERLEKKGVAKDSAEWRTAQKEHDDVVRDEVFTGDQLVRTDIVNQELQIVVAFEFKDERKPYFERFTERHVKENMAILLDNSVDSAPVIESTLPGKGIIRGGGVAGFTQKDARDLAIVLESGSTGINLNLSREESLGPSLGEVAIQRGMWSVIVGFVLVVVTMVYYYRLPGLSRTSR
jgi:protein-export membrane protein SecD